MTTGEIIVFVTGILGIITALCAIATFLAKNKKQGYDEGRDDGGLRGDVKYVRNGVDDLRLDFKDMNRKYDTQAERITRCEESCKQAHKRLDGLETRGGK